MITLPLKFRSVRCEVSVSSSGFFVPFSPSRKCHTAKCNSLLSSLRRSLHGIAPIFRTRRTNLKRYERRMRMCHVSRRFSVRTSASAQGSVDSASEKSAIDHLLEHEKNIVPKKTHILPLEVPAPSKTRELWNRILESLQPLLTIAAGRIFIANFVRTVIPRRPIFLALDSLLKTFSRIALKALVLSFSLTSLSFLLLLSHFPPLLSRSANLKLLARKSSVCDFRLLCCAAAAEIHLREGGNEREIEVVDERIGERSWAKKETREVGKRKRKAKGVKKYTPSSSQTHSKRCLSAPPSPPPHHSSSPSSLVLTPSSSLYPSFSLPRSPSLPAIRPLSFFVGERQDLSLSFSPSLFSLSAFDLSPKRLIYLWDSMLEANPTSYIFLLFGAVFTLTLVGGLCLTATKKDPLGEALWVSWGNVSQSRAYLRESSIEGRVIGMMLNIGGILFYSLLTSTLTTNFKMRMEWLKEGDHTEVIDKGHVIIAGFNSRLPTVLKELNKSQEFAVLNGSAMRRKQKVVLLTNNPKKEMEKSISSLAKKCEHLEISLRSGSLSSQQTFKRAAADKSSTIILLAGKNDYYEADADCVLSLLALKPILKDHKCNVVAEVSKPSTAELLRSFSLVPGNAPPSSLSISPIENLQAKLFVQCSRQPGLVDVYRKMLDHEKVVINLRNFPTISGLPYRAVRKGFTDAIVCGLVRDGRVMFHPRENERLREKDKLMLVAPKNTQRVPPRHLEKLSLIFNSHSISSPELTDTSAKNTELPANSASQQINRRPTDQKTSSLTSQFLSVEYEEMIRERERGGEREGERGRTEEREERARGLLDQLVEMGLQEESAPYLSSELDPTKSTKKFEAVENLAKLFGGSNPKKTTIMGEGRSAVFSDNSIQIEKGTSSGLSASPVTALSFSSTSLAVNQMRETISGGMGRKEGETGRERAGETPGGNVELERGEDGGERGDKGAVSTSTTRLPPKKQFKTPDWTTAGTEKILMLGWRRGVVDMIKEYDNYVGPKSELVILAEEPIEERCNVIRRMIRQPLNNLTVRHKVGNPMSRTDLEDAIGAAVPKNSSPYMFKNGKSKKEKSNLQQHRAYVFEHDGEDDCRSESTNERVPFSVVVISDHRWQVGGQTKPDKQAVFSLLLAESLCRHRNIKVQSFVAELDDISLGEEVVKSHPSLTYIGTSNLMGLVTAQVAEHSELNAVWTELLNSWGDEIYMKHIHLYAEHGESVTFDELSERSLQRAEVAIGYRRDGKVVINPYPRSVPLEFGEKDDLIVMSEFE